MYRPFGRIAGCSPRLAWILDGRTLVGLSDSSLPVASLCHSRGGDPCVCRLANLGLWPDPRGRLACPKVVSGTSQRPVILGGSPLLGDTAESPLRHVLARLDFVAANRPRGWRD